MKKKVVTIEMETDHSNEFLKKVYRELKLVGTTIKQVQVNFIKKEDKKR